ncbi:homeobox-leucine zipper protein HAT22-like [Rosa rugosa]|uniref:homeobox-leucine zipper protein HAT22-like n=1 Tax=Rosa rugosa TaxID=74645 RepID=UPI002B400844|nr:homeobox-leucine zipper protein HAT22-like [Rosa rugosa]
MGFDDPHACNTGLVLGLGLTASQESTSPTSQKAHHQMNPMLKKPNSFEPSLTLGLFGNSFHEDDHQGNSLDLYRQGSPHNSHSAVSNSFSSGRVVKRERDLSSEEVEVEKVSSRVISDEDEDGPNARKKLRLSKEQSALLEESFKQHSTLNPKQKQALARQLSLRPRQVEVWFQNRRARTKLKQTEVDCEFLKKCCETLTDENRRLQKEVQELKALKLSQQQPLFMHMPAATLTMCPSCERIGGVGSEGANSNKSPFSIAHTKPHFYNPFTNSSAAC